MSRTETSRRLDDARLGRASTARWACGTFDRPGPVNDAGGLMSPDTTATAPLLPPYDYLTVRSGKKFHLHTRPFVMENPDALYHFKRWRRHKIRDYVQLKEYFRGRDAVWAHPPGEFLANAAKEWHDAVFSEAGWDAFRQVDDADPR